MTTLQEYLDRKYPMERDKEFVAREIILNWISKEVKERGMEDLEGGELDLRKFKGAEGVLLEKCFLKTPVTKINVNGLANLQMLVLSYNNLTSLDLSGCVKLEVLALNNNQFSSLDLSGFDCVNLRELYINGNNLISLNLSGCPNLTKLIVSDNDLTSLDLSGCPNLITLSCAKNKLFSVDFLKNLPNPEKLERLEIYDNNIQPTTLDFLKPFVNLKDCKLGENVSKNGDKLKQRLQARTYNKFYGFLEPIKNLTKLEKFCVADTDIDEGLEYMPLEIAKLSSQAVAKGEDARELNLIDCQPLREGAKVAKIQDQLRPFNYDLLAWQLAHPEKMLISHPEYFTQENSREQWISALSNKITQSHQELDQIKERGVEKVKKIARLESQISELTKVKEAISQQNKTKFSTQDKATRTNLTNQDYEQQQEEIKELKEKIN